MYSQYSAEYNRNVALSITNDLRIGEHIRSTRKGCRSIGNAIEDRVGVEENNFSDADKDGTELKAARYDSNTPTTLFTKRPTVGSSRDVTLRDPYGYIDEKGRRACKRDIHANSEHMRCRASTTGVEVYDPKSTEVLFYWSMEDLDKGVKKLNSLLMIEAVNTTDGDTNLHTPVSSVHYSGFDMNQFIAAINNGVLVMNPRFHLMLEVSKRTGLPKSRDRGFAFRIDRERMHLLYQNSEKMG